MKNLTRFGAAGILLLSFLQSAAQQQPTTVNLKVIHNGRLRPAPAEIKIIFGGHSLRIPVRDGKFAVPPEVVSARRVTFETDVEGDHLRLTHITGADFGQEDWTLRLAERADVEYYDWPDTKGVNIRDSCILEFESAHTHSGRVHFEQNCRSKKK